MHAPPARRRALPDVRRHRAYRTLMAWGKRRRLRGGHVSLYDVGERMLHELRLDSLEKRAAYMAFNLTLALFPTIIFLFTLIPYIPVPDLKSEFVKLNAEGSNNLILDLQNVKYTDSSGLSSILIANRLCNSTGGLLVLTGLQDHVLKLITISKLESVLHILPTVEEGIDRIFLHSIERDLTDKE